MTNLFANSSCLFIGETAHLSSVNKYSISADDLGTHVSGTMNASWDNKGTGVSGVMGGKGELYHSPVFYELNGNISEKYGTAYSYLYR